MDVQTSKDPLYFDDLLRQIGGTGAYQIIFFIIAAMVRIISEEAFYITFIAAKMPHWCKVKELEKLPFEVQKNVAIPSDNSNDWASTGAYSQCQMFNFNYSAYSTQDFLIWNRTLQAIGNTPVSCTDGWTYDKSQFASSAVSEYNLVCGRAWLVPLLSTAYLGGQLLGAISAGAFSDRFGRRPVIVVYGFIKLAGGVFTAFAPNYGCMFAARLINGIGCTGTSLIFFVLVIEVSVGKARTIFGTGIMIAFAIGYMIIPALALNVRDFRKFSIVMIGPSVIVFFLWWIVPESPRWLLIKGKLKQADKAIRFIADVNNRPLPNDFDISQIKMNDGKRADLPKRNILDLFKRRKICVWTLNVFLYWFSGSLVYNALSLNAGNLAGDVFLNVFLLGFVEIPANVLLTFTLQWRPMGRRISSSASLLLAGGVSVICIPLVVTGTSPTATTALSLIGKVGSTMAYSAAFVYTGEIFPTEVRNVALGSASTLAHASGMVAPFVGGILGEVWAGLPHLVYGVLGIVSGLLMLHLPETLGRPLCETLDEAEALGNSKEPVAQELAIYPAGAFSQIEASVGTTHRKPYPTNVNPAYNEEID